MVANPQKVLVQESFAAVMPIADDAAALFYHRLFELDPSLRAHVQGRHDGAAAEAACRCSRRP